MVTLEHSFRISTTAYVSWQGPEILTGGNKMKVLWCIHKSALTLTNCALAQFSSVPFSPSDVSNSLRPYELQHAGLPCLSLTPRACLNSCPSSRWCYPTISPSVIPFSSWLQSFPASGSLHQVAKVFELQLQHQSSQWVFRVDNTFIHQEKIKW